METREVSASQSRTSKWPAPSIFPGRTRPGVVVGSPIAVLDDQPFDNRALLRWADDGGRYLEQGLQLQEVRV
jgi:hypothetical protein